MDDVLSGFQLFPWDVFGALIAIAISKLACREARRPEKPSR